MMIKRFTLFIISVIVLCLTTFAQDTVKVFINQEQVIFDASPQIINNRALVPMRKIFETLGAVVEWHGESQIVLATKNELIIIMEIGKPTLSITNVISGKTRNVPLDSPPIILNSRTLIPVRAISESLGYDVDWINDTRTVLITARN